MKILYKNFTTNEDVYKRAQGFWVDITSKYINEALDGQFFVSSVFSQSIIEKDGNPIFRCFIKKLKIGIRIIQYDDLKPDEYDIQCWLDDIQWLDQYIGEKELVIACCPTEENCGKIENILKEWILNKKFVEEDW